MINGVLSDPIVATHTFARDGVYNGSVQLRNPDGTLTRTVGRLNDVALASGIAETTAGTALPEEPIAELAPPACSQSLSLNPAYYTATVDFGDGSTPAPASPASRRPRRPPWLPSSPSRCRPGCTRLDPSK